MNTHQEMYYLCAQNLDDMARKKKRIVAKEPIKLWFKPLPSGNKSVYLFTRRGDKKEYERLNLILVPEIDSINRMRNAETLRMAMEIQAQRILSINAEAHGLKRSSPPELKMNLI